MSILAALSDRERASRMVPCDRDGASAGESCTTLDGSSHRVRQILAIEHGHLDDSSGEWLTREMWSAA
jgi:hypothetical protein